MNFSDHDRLEIELAYQARKFEEYQWTNWRNNYKTPVQTKAQHKATRARRKAVKKIPPTQPLSDFS